MQRDFLLEIDPPEWRGVMDQLYYYFSSDKDLRDSLGGIEREALEDYRNEERDAVNTKTVEYVSNIVNNSEPAIELGKEYDAHIERTFNMKGERVELKDPKIQRYVFQPFNAKEIAERAEVSKPSAERYKYAEANPPKELFKESFEEVTAWLDAGFDIQGDVYHKPLFGSFNNPVHNSNRDNSVLLEDAGLEEIRKVNQAVRDLEALERDNPRAYGALESNPESVSRIAEAVENPMRSEVSRKELDTSSSRFYDGLTDMGVLELWGGKGSGYCLNASEPYMKALDSML